VYIAVLQFMPHGVRKLWIVIKNAFKEEGFIYLLKKSYKAPIWISRAIYESLFNYYLLLFYGESLLQYEQKNKNIEGLEKHQETKDIERTKILYDQISQHVDSSSKILSIGCHTGGRMSYLHENGLTNLYGIEINKNAVDLMKKNHPELYSDSKIYIGSCQDVLERLDDNEFDIVYAVSTLQLVNKNGKETFDNISRVTRSVLITMEKEKKEKSKHKGEFRNYGEIFSSRGFTQIYEKEIWVKKENNQKSVSHTRVENATPQVMRVFKKF